MLRSTRYQPALYVCLIVTLLAAVLPTTAVAQGLPSVAAGGTAGADQQGTASFDAVGPAIAGPEYIEPVEDLDTVGRGGRLIADSEGHLLVQGSTVSGDDPVDQLIAINAADGSVAWRVDGISTGCQPIATDDGRIFAQRVLNFELEGPERNFSADPVEIDAATGDIVNRYTSPDTDELPRIGECYDGLRLGADGVLLAFQGQNFQIQVVAFDTTVQPMEEVWRVDNAPAENGDRFDAAAFDRIVVSPDGSVVTYGKRLTDTDGELSLVLESLDVASGDVVASTTVPGTTFVTDGILHVGEDIVVLTAATGGQDDPERLISLSADGLAENWVVEAVADSSLDGINRVALTGDVVAVHTGRDIVGLDLADGTQVWEQDATSFTNNGAQLVTDGAGKVYFSSFGGSPLEIADGTSGASVFVAPDTEEFLGTGVLGEASTLGPILDDGRLYAMHPVVDGGTAVVAYGSGTERLDGGTGDPIDIAIQLCQYLFGEDGARTVVLSRDDVFADTLAGAPLAGDHSCILFTPGGADEPIDPRTLEEIGRALPDGATVRIAGGVNAVSEQVEDAVSGAGFTIERLEGPSRIETAVAIGRVVLAEGADQPNGDVVAMVARADDWPDAVAGGAAFSRIGSPVLLTNSDSLHPATAAAIEEFGVGLTFIAGGPSAVSEAAALDTPFPMRVSGPNRHATAAAFAADIWGDNAAEGEFVLANLEFEQGWALALAASPLSVRIGAPQLGVRADDLPVETSDYLTAAGVTDPGLIVLGDLTVVSGEVVEAVEVTTGR